MLACNKIQNVKRRAARAGYGNKSFCVTCGASRHTMMIADAMLERHDHPLLEDPEHCATSIYSVLESLWKARAEIKRMKASMGSVSKKSWHKKSAKWPKPPSIKFFVIMEVRKAVREAGIEPATKGL